MALRPAQRGGGTPHPSGLCGCMAWGRRARQVAIACPANPLQPCMRPCASVGARRRPPRVCHEPRGDDRGRPARETTGMVGRAGPLQFSYFEICHYNFSYIRILPFYTYFTCLGPLSACIHVHIFRMDENTHATSLPDVWTPLIRFFFNLQLRGRPPRRVPALPRRPLPRRIDAAATDDTGGGVSTVCLRVFFGGPLPAPPRRGRRGCRGRGRSCTRRSREGTAGR